MKTISKELDFCKTTLFILGRDEKEYLLRHSNLNEKEFKILRARFIEGLTLKEIGTEFNIEEDTVCKYQQRATKKLYFWLSNRSEIEKMWLKLKDTKIHI